MTAGLILLAPPSAQADGTDPQAAVRAGDAKHAGELLSPHPAEQAMTDAVRTGKEVPVPSLTDEFSTTVATPEGKLRQDRHLDAQRTKRSDGSWTGLDDSLVKRGDGSLTPAAASENLVISGGGTGPLATMTTKDGKQLSVGSPFPGALPTPTVSGNSAIFASVAPDTDLKVTVTEFGGYTTVLVLHTPAAAANPAVRSLNFPTTSKGLELSNGADGSLKASSEGETVFAAPPPQMWSAGAPTTAATTTDNAPSDADTTAVVRSAFAETSEPAPDPSASELSTADGPGPAATMADIPVTTSAGPGGKGTIHLSPSPELLDGENTSYPIYVDPSWSNDARGKSHYTWVQSGYPTTSNFDKPASGKPGVGYQGYLPTKGIERALYEFNLNGYFNNTAIDYANLHVTQNWSSDFSCTNAYPVTLYRAGAFDSGTTWNNHSKLEWVDSKNVPGNGNSVNCMGGIGVDYNITAPMRSALADVSKPLAFALVGNEGTGDQNGFKRFEYDAVLSTLYDHPPLTPSDPKALPTPNRVTAPDTDACYDAPLSVYGWVTSTGVTLSSVVSSYNQSQLTEFASIWDNAVAGAPGVASGWSGFVPNNSRATYIVPLGTLKDGHYYGWQTQGDDGLLRGPATPVCHFAVDTTPPVAAFGTFTNPDTQFPPSGNGQTTNLSLGATGKIPFTAYDPNPSGLLASGLSCVRWGYDPQLVGADQVCGTPLSVTELTTTPTHWGTNILYAQVFDEAGNASQTLSYAFYVPWTNGPVIFGDTTGDHRPDILIPDAAGNLITHGRATDPGNTSVPPSGTAAAARQAPPETGKTWKDYRVTHRGSLDPGKNTDDLFVHRDATPGLGDGSDKLYFYANPELHAGAFTADTRRNLDRPDCAGNCPGYHQGNQWRYSSQITPIGSPNNLRATDRNVTNGVLAVEADSLWYYAADTNGTLRPPVLVAAGGWDNQDLMVPGNTLAIDPTGTVATTPALWARARTTSGGRTEGDLYQYALTFESRTDGATSYDVVTALTASPAGPIVTGFKASTYPTVGSDGDQTGDGIPDLWALDTAGNLRVWPATATNGRVTGLGADHYRGNTQAPLAQWPLHETGDAVPGTPVATGTAVTYIDDPVDGQRHTNVAVLNGSNSALTTAVPALANPNQSFTLSTWVKSTGAGGVIASQSTAHAASFLLYSEGTGGSWRFALATADNDAWPYVYTSTSNNAALVKTGTWTQLTASFNATTGEMSLYVNGALAGSANRSTAPSLPTNGAFVLGRYQSQSSLAPTAQNPSFNGSISNFAVYSSAVVPEPTTTAIRHASTADCLDVPNNDTSQGISVTGCNNSPAQNFIVNPADATINLRTTMCLELTGGNTANGAAVGLDTCAPGTDRQKWLTRANGSLYNPASGRCLELPNNDTTPGTRLRILDCNGTPAQTWSIPTINTPNLPVNPWILPDPTP
ncbi:ricin-type beta-trefoil lectin domain protein [Kitasatospora herbaricolor]|uniref:Ricin-type beta-trefoil lectin domain protein n=1 Tax=Kitasatospora herbaricolor TaxID=68217 RepID=A0ABZ1W0R7_9ACTN|nr:ricin-type beta-trefoil lectin domain protein [Kitasatospora herbaricolor]